MPCGLQDENTNFYCDIDPHHKCEHRAHNVNGELIHTWPRSMKDNKANSTPATEKIIKEFNTYGDKYGASSDSIPTMAKLRV